jgi:FRG domain
LLLMSCECISVAIPDCRDPCLTVCRRGSLTNVDEFGRLGMTSFFGSPTWADIVLSGAEEGDFGLYRFDPDTRRLMIDGERPRPSVHGYTGSPGWKTLATQMEYETRIWEAPGETRIWAAPGVIEMFQEQKKTVVISPEGEKPTTPRNWNDVLRLYINGKAFVHERNIYLLPDREFALNSFNYERPNGEPLTVFVGYRGHAHPYPLVITPSLLHGPAGADRSRYLHYKVREGYATNLLREAYWRHKRKVLQDLEACGILQHHKTIGPTDLLDLSYDLDVAKAFALSDYIRGKYTEKKWLGPEDYSCVYKTMPFSLS